MQENHYNLYSGHECQTEEKVELTIFEMVLVMLPTVPTTVRHPSRVDLGYRSPISSACW